MKPVASVIRTDRGSTRGRKFCFEQSDKCGDGCLGLPGGGRISSVNASKFTFNLAVQANLFGPAINLFFIFPHLKTGTNFGATSFTLTLFNMVQAGLLTKETTDIFRGSDGGAELVSLTNHGVHIMVARRTQKIITWGRLPPNHSHEGVDRFFSWMEGLLTNPANSGCATFWDLLELLKSAHRKSTGYKDTLLNLQVQLVNRNFDRWFEGHINRDQISGVKTPLVYRYVPDGDDVRVFFKHSLTDKGTFDLDEWGPWKLENVQANDPVTGRVGTRQVKSPAPPCPAPPRPVQSNAAPRSPRLPRPVQRRAAVAPHRPASTRAVPHRKWLKPSSGEKDRPERHPDDGKLPKLHHEPWV